VLAEMRKYMRNYPILLIVLIISMSCADHDLKRGQKIITVSGLEQYVSNLGSDKFMGRKPFSEGEKITVKYLADQLAEIGFEPAFGGSWFQSVPMIEICSEINAPVNIVAGKTQLFLDAPDDIAVTSQVLSDRTDIKNSEMVFAGFGIVAPEYGRNDYKDLDVKGKTVVVLINDPGLYTGDTT
jgi:hypothetical protein